MTRRHRCATCRQVKFGERHADPRLDQPCPPPAVQLCDLNYLLARIRDLAIGASA